MSAVAHAETHRDRYNVQRLVAKRADTAFRQRLRAEQSEARALGVAVVDRPHVDSRWTEEERDVLRALYPDYAQMRAKLPHRRPGAIKTQCKVIGIVETRVSLTTADRLRLKKLYPVATTDELRAAFPGFTYTRIQNCAVKMGLSRPKAGPKPTGNALLDSIMQRARELNLTMIDLDRMAQTGNYFCGRQWSRGTKKNGHSHHQMVKAILAMGGSIRAEWGED